MTKNRKGRADWHQATLNTYQYIRHSTILVTHIKAAIVTLALWGLLPIPLAEWLINWIEGESHDE